MNNSIQILENPLPDVNRKDQYALMERVPGPTNMISTALENHKWICIGKKRSLKNSKNLWCIREALWP